jgi:imidazolonepropionase-like amidohydrolase
MRHRIGFGVVGRRRIALLAASLIAASTSAFADAPAPVVIDDIAIVDVERGALLPSRDVVIVDGRIESIAAHATHATFPPNAQHVDGHRRFAIPGLVDMHVHLFNSFSKRPPNTWTFPLFVANGVTGVREMAGLPTTMPTIREWRAASDRGDLVAPRIVAAGVVVNGDSPEQAAERVGLSADAGSDFIKVFSDVSEANWRAMLDAARARGVPLLGHVPAGVSFVDAAKSGQRTAEHLMQAFEACTPIERELLDARRGLDGNALVEKRDADESRVLAAFDQPTCDRVAAALAKTGEVQVPTLVLPYVESSPLSNLDRDPRWKYLRPDEGARWTKIEASLSPEEHRVGAERWPVAKKIAATFHRAGVTMLAGTDTPMPGVYPGFSLHEELARFVDAGFTPAEALRAATLEPARLFGRADSEGSIAAGKRAEIVVLDADPLVDIANARKIRAVVLDGRLFDRMALDALLDGAAREAAKGPPSR